MVTYSSTLFIDVPSRGKKEPPSPPQPYYPCPFLPPLTSTKQKKKQTHCYDNREKKSRFFEAKEKKNSKKKQDHSVCLCCVSCSIVLQLLFFFFVLFLVPFCLPAFLKKKSVDVASTQTPHLICSPPQEGKFFIQRPVSLAGPRFVFSFVSFFFFFCSFVVFVSLLQKKKKNKERQNKFWGKQKQTKRKIIM